MLSCTAIHQGAWVVLSLLCKSTSIELMYKRHPFLSFLRREGLVPLKTQQKGFRRQPRSSASQKIIQIKEMELVVGPVYVKVFE